MSVMGYGDKYTELIKLGLNDVIMIRVPQRATATERLDIMKIASNAFPDHAALKKILIIDKSIKFEIIATEAIDDILLKQNTGE